MTTAHLPPATNIRAHLQSLIAIHGRETSIPLYVATAGDLADLYAKLDEQKAEISLLSEEIEVLKSLASISDDDALASDMGDAKREAKFGKGL